jgi:hypothetical protein
MCRVFSYEGFFQWKSKCLGDSFAVCGIGSEAVADVPLLDEYL